MLNFVLGFASAIAVFALLGLGIALAFPPLPVKMVSDAELAWIIAYGRRFMQGHR